MSLFVQLDKLHFIVQEMELALYLARRAPDEFTSRVHSRHILIRAENFIEHARRIKGSLNKYRFKTTEYHKQKEIYAKFFKEYFQIARNKLGGHVQDCDFGKRVELWNDIETVKIGFFVESAKDIYTKILGSMRIPGFIPYSPISDIASPELSVILEELASPRRNSNGVVIGADSLAITRPNTVVTLNMTPVHSRAQQICLICRWITVQRELFDRTSTFAGVARILKARIITDVVSLCDCLVTRLVPSGVPQDMDGLEKILNSLGQDASPITDFIAHYRFEEKLKQLRHVRNIIGSHVEISPSEALTQLLASLDASIFIELMSFFERLKSVFIKTCRMVDYLRPYAVDNQPLYGIKVASESSAIERFDDNAPKLAHYAPAQPNWNDGNVYQSNLNMWLGGDQCAKAEARYYFWEAFQRAEVVEKVEEIELIGKSGKRSKQHNLRKAHLFMLEQLALEKEPAVVSEMLELLISCRNGFPHILAEIIVRHGEAHTVCPGDAAVCIALGLVADWPHSRVKKFLDGNISTSEWLVQFHAILAHFRIFVRSEGIKRANKKTIIDTYAGTIAPMLSGTSECQRLLLMLAFASQFCGGLTAHYFKHFEEDYKGFQKDIRTLAESVLGNVAYNTTAETVEKLLSSHDYAGVTLVLYDQLKQQGNSALAERLVAAVVNGWVVSCNHDQSTCNLSCCLLRAGLFDDALLVADNLASCNPEDPHYQLLKVQILAATPGKLKEAHAALDAVIKDYALEGDCNKFANKLRESISQSVS